MDEERRGRPSFWSTVKIFAVGLGPFWFFFMVLIMISVEESVFGIGDSLTDIVLRVLGLTARLLSGALGASLALAGGCWLFLFLANRLGLNLKLRIIVN
ncbi:MAG: hypothetical protein JKP92_07095 [Alphaproteobacteria bacterium]|jgi:hypothetical protein|nr:hypothetical protein [Alphaproteobacteria bacterium]